MEPRITFRSKDKDETSPQAPPSPLDTEDYFELAYEADEFGVHVPEYLAVR